MAKKKVAKKATKKKVVLKAKAKKATTKKSAPKKSAKSAKTAKPKKVAKRTHSFRIERTTLDKAKKFKVKISEAARAGIVAGIMNAAAKNVSAKSKPKAKAK